MTAKPWQSFGDAWTHGFAEGYEWREKENRILSEPLFDPAPVLWYDVNRVKPEDVEKLKAGKMLTYLPTNSWGWIKPTKPTKPTWWVPTSKYLEPPYVTPHAYWRDAAEYWRNRSGV